MQLQLYSTAVPTTCKSSSNYSSRRQQQWPIAAVAVAGLPTLAGPQVDSLAPTRHPAARVVYGAISDGIVRGVEAQPDGFLS